MKREAVIAGLAYEGLALILGSAEAGSLSIVNQTPPRFNDTITDSKEDVLLNRGDS